MTARDRIAERMQTAVVETGAGRVRLRPPRPTDAAPLHTLVADTLAEGRWFLRHPAELDPSPDALVASLEDPARHAVVVVATLGGAVVGLATVSRNPLRRCRHVGGLELRVASAHRGAGIGRALLARAHALAEADPDLQRLCLQVFADNPRAVRLYEATGYRVEGRLRGEVREEDGTLRDVVLMARDVAGPAGP